MFTQTHKHLFCSKLIRFSSKTKMWVFLFSLLLYLNGSGQTNNKYFTIFAKGSLGTDNLILYQNYSIGGELRYLENNFGLNYNLEYVYRTDNKYQLHGSIGMFAGPPIIGLGAIKLFSKKVYDGQGVEGGLIMIGGILTLLIPEGISYHFPLNKNMDFAPYANLLGMDFMEKRPNPEKYLFPRLRYAATFGTKLNYCNDKGIGLFLFGETRKTSGLYWTYGGGAGITYRILMKN